MLRKATLAALALSAACLGTAQAKLQYEKYTLPNGLTVILHEDHSLPVAAVDVWYKVGSKDEAARRSGFAHLFEHLMFMGTKRVPNGKFDSIMEAAGGENNASTAEDRTEFHESGPSNLLPTFLWLEADRLETLGRDIDQAKLNLQRNVVENERRQTTENTPYGSAEEAINGLMFPPSHPYGHSVIGSMSDLEAASVGDVKGFFATYYVPNNAILAVVGDFRPQEIKAQIARLFGTLPRRDDPPRNIPPDFDFKTKRVTMVDRVAKAKVIMVWHSPARFAPGDSALDVVAGALSDGVSSRLYRRLVTGDKLATDVQASQNSLYLDSLFTIEVTAAESASLDKLEAAVDDEIQRFDKDGPAQAEIERIQAQAEVGLAKAQQSAEELANSLTEYEFYLGTPDGFSKTLEEIRRVTPAQAREQAQRTLDPNARLVLRVLPQSPAAPAKDPRDLQPKIGPASAFTAPVPQEFTLSDGLRVRYFQRTGVPLVSMALLARRGASAEPLDKAGESSLMADLLSAGAGTRDAATFESDLERLGATFAADATGRSTVVGLTVLERNLDKALPLYADTLIRPRFAAEELERAKRVKIAQLQERANDPAALAAKVAREAYFGANSPLGRPVDGTPKSVGAITKADVEDAYRRSLGPADSELFVAGGLPVETIRAALEKNIGDWKSPAAPSSPDSFSLTSGPLRILIVDHPGAVQTNARFIFPAPALGDANRAAAESATIALGGSFTSRLVQNIREKNGYAYGASARYTALPGLGYLQVGSDIRSDATVPAVKEFLKEFARLRGGDLTAAEVAKSAQLRRAEAIQALASLDGLIGEAEFYATENEPLAQLDKDLTALSSLKATGVNASAMRALQSDRGVLVLVGDRAIIVKALVEAGLTKGELVKG